MLKFFSKIQNILVILFTTLSIILLLASGYVLHWSVRSSMEHQLGQKLTAVASSVSVIFSEDEINFLMQNPGKRVTEYFQSRLSHLANSVNAGRIFLFSKHGRSIIDTDTTMQAGAELFSLKFYPAELDKVFKGRQCHSILFTTSSGQPRMTGFAPIFVKGSVAGGIGVEGDALFLNEINRLDKKLLMIGIFGVIAAAVLGIITASIFTRQIKKLVRISEQIGRGEYHNRVDVHSATEIGKLADTMEIMRQSIIHRQDELKALVGGIAHEIRNPLGGIELFTGLLAKQASTVKEREYCETISKELLHLNKIVNDFLNYAKPHTPAVCRCSLKEEIDEIIKLTKNDAAEKSISVQTSVKKTFAVAADKNHLHQILLNIIRNAIDAAPEKGKIKITGIETKNRIACTIEDTGPGIPTEIKDRIFSPFFSTKDNGTGLGLSIVKSLAEANGADIRIVTAEKSGTKFEVSFKRFKKS
ncbi:HAMP domain-containing histidine kinase [bacterium]|nr:HAMP domain-containing histidine kinase [bacterium]